MKRLFYSFMRAIISIGLRLYFNKIEINGLDQLKDKGKTFLFCPNHQSAFLDALIIGVFSPTPIHSLTRSNVFKPPFMWFLTALNMMPAYRKRDGYANLSKNEAIFEASKSLLQQGKSMLIFPEAIHHQSYYLRPLTKGFARVALRSALDNPNPNPIYIVPVGINYFHDRFPRHKLLLNFGNAIRVADYLDDYQRKEVDAYNAIRIKLTEEMKACLIIPDKTAQYEDQLKVLTRANESLSFAELRVQANDANLPEQINYPQLMPIAHLFSLPNLPLHLFSNKVLRGLKEIEFFSSIKFVFGLLLFPVWLLLVFLLAKLFFGGTWALVILAVQVISLFLRQQLLRYTH